MTGDLEPLSPEEGAQRFLQHREPSVRDSTLKNAQTRLNHFLKWADETEIENLNVLTGRHLSEFVEWRREQVAPITLQKQLSTIRMALRWWADIEAVPEGLAEKVHAPELPDGAEVRDEFLSAERTEKALEYYGKHQYASREHALLSVLWRTGMRRSAVHSIDVDDLQPEEYALRLEHRIEQGTRLKNGDDGNRWVYLGPEWYQIVEDYLNDPDRVDGTDEYGRRPLFKTNQGTRPKPGTIYNWVVRALHPCSYTECPHDRTPSTCEARGRSAKLSKCPSSISPHAIRRGAITSHLNEDISPELVSERMDVSLGTLYQHYDARTDREKMAVRKKHLDI